MIACCWIVAFRCFFNPELLSLVSHTFARVWIQFDAIFTERYGPMLPQLRKRKAVELEPAPPAQITEDYTYELRNCPKKYLVREDPSFKSATGPRVLWCCFGQSWWAPLPSWELNAHFQMLSCLINHNSS
eukprot:m.450823 g.450823  ORF g.450823 m.450823 type:complete len:130 (-) comp56910_c1_seq1:451-840(-)